MACRGTTAVRRKPPESKNVLVVRKNGEWAGWTLKAGQRPGGVLSVWQRLIELKFRNGFRIGGVESGFATRVVVTEVQEAVWTLVPMR